MSTVVADGAGLPRLMGSDRNRVELDADHSCKPFRGQRQLLMVDQVTGEARNWWNETAAASTRTTTLGVVKRSYARPRADGVTIPRRS